MEEVKKKAALKGVAGKEEKEESKEEKEKLTYDQLNTVAQQLNEQVKQLYSKLQESNLNNMFRRLDYLFKVIENKDSFNQEFVVKCSEEIMQAMTIPEEPKEDNKD